MEKSANPSIIQDIKPGKPSLYIKQQGLCGSVAKNMPANAYMGSIPGLGISPGGGNGNQLSTLAWEIPWTEESARPQSKGLQRVGSDLAIKQQQNKCWHTYIVKYYGDIKSIGFEEFIKKK